MESSASWAQILGCMVGPRSCSVTRLAKEGDSERLHNLGQGVGLADASASKPYSSVVVFGNDYRQQMHGLVRSGIEALLQVQCEVCHGVNLLPGASSIRAKVPCYCSWAFS